MRNILDIASWSALALLAITALAKPSDPPKPATDTIQVIAPASDVPREQFDRISRSADAVQARIVEVEAKLTALATKPSKDHDCPCGPNCKCVGGCRCSYPGECLEAEPTVAEPKWYTQLTDARRAARASKLPVLVHFYTETCAPCKLMDARVFPDPAVQDYLARNAIACRVDADTLSERDRAAWGIAVVPTDFVIQAGWPANSKMARLPLATDPDTYLGGLQNGVKWAKQPPKQASVVTQSSSQPAYYEPQRYYYQPVYQPMYYGGGWGGGGCASGNCGW